MRVARHKNVGFNAWILIALGKEIDLCETVSDLEIFISSAKILIDAKNTRMMSEKIKVVQVPYLQAIPVISKFYIYFFVTEYSIQNLKKIKY